MQDVLVCTEAAAVWGGGKEIERGKRKGMLRANKLVQQEPTSII